MIRRKNGRRPAGLYNNRWTARALDAPFLNILKLSAQDLGGGAAEVARRLAGAYRQRGHRCMMAVGEKRGNDADVFELPDSGEGPWSRTLFGLRDTLSPLLGRVRGAGRVHDMPHVLGRPRRPDLSFLFGCRQNSFHQLRSHH